MEKSIISIGHLPELNELHLRNGYFEIGSGTKLTDLQNFLTDFVLNQNISGYSDQLPLEDKHDYRLTAQCILSTFTNWFSGNQIKNVAVRFIYACICTY